MAKANTTNDQIIAQVIGPLRKLAAGITATSAAFFHEDREKSALHEILRAVAGDLVLDNLIGARLGLSEFERRARASKWYTMTRDDQTELYCLSDLLREESKRRAHGKG